LRLGRVEIGDATFALRVLRPNQKEQARREIVAMSLAKTAGLPVPAVIASGEWSGMPATLVRELHKQVPLMIRMEDSELELRFGDAYRLYRTSVPAVIPRVP